MEIVWTIIHFKRCTNAPISPAFALKSDHLNTPIVSVVQINQALYSSNVEITG